MYNPVYGTNRLFSCYSPCMTTFKLAHAYVPFQHLNCIYPPMLGLESGTIFPELNSPYGTDPEYTVDE